MPLDFQQKINFRGIPEEREDNFNFDGGLITDKHETKLEPNQSPNLANVTFNNTGSVKTRDGYERYNNDPIGSSSDQSNTGTSAGTVEADAPGDFIAQTFQPSGDIEVTQVDLYLAMETADEEQRVRVELWSTDSGEPDALLTNGQSQILVIDDDSEAAVNFRFRIPVSLSASTTYAIVLKPSLPSSVQTVNHVLAHRTGAAYANGQIYTSTDSGSSWSAAGNDLKFVVYDGGDTGGTGLIRFYNTSGVKQMFTNIGGTLYRGNDSTGAMTTIALGKGSELHATNDIDWTVADNTLLIVDNDGKIQKYRGSTKANYSTGTISVTSGSPVVTGSGTSWTSNAEVGMYLQVPASNKWYKIKSISSDTELALEDGYIGSTASGEDYVISAWGEVKGDLESALDSGPSGYQFIENHYNRVWILDGNTLKYSTLFGSINHEHFNDWTTTSNAGTINIPAGQGDSGAGLYSFNGYLYIFQKNAIWELTGTGPANFELRNISNEIGMVSKNTLVEYDRYLIFLSEQGLYLFDGANLINLSQDKVNNHINSWANKSSCHAALHENSYLISYTPAGESFNSEILVYDIKKDIFGKMTRAYANQWVNWDGGDDTGQLYFVSSNQGTIYKWDSGTHDDGYEIETLYDTPSLSFGAGVNDKTVKKVYLQQIAKGDWTMDATQFSDLTSTESSSEIDLNPGDAALWDVAEWDVGSWADEGSLVTTRIAQFQGIAKYFKYRFEQTGYSEGIEILGLTVTARLRRLR